MLGAEVWTDPVCVYAVMCALAAAASTQQSHSLTQ